MSTVQAEHQYLGLRDLRGFDEEATGLVLEYQLHGWTGFMSGQGHAIMRAPDGVATASIARKSLNGRSGRNARRPLNQWLQRREFDRKAPGESFGIERGPREVSEFDPPWQAAEKQSYESRLRMRKALIDWWDDMTTDIQDGATFHLIEADEDEWVVMYQARRHAPVQLAGAGSAVPEDEIERLLAEAKDFNEKHDRESEASVAKQGPREAELHKCSHPGCNQEFDSQRAVQMHALHHQQRDAPCPLCDRVLGHAGGLALHLKSKTHQGDPRLPKALEMYTNSGKSFDEKPDIVCEYCGKMIAPRSKSGHYRGHTFAGHQKRGANSGGTTQDAKVTTATDSPAEASEAVTAAPAKPDGVVVGTVTPTVSTAVVNGTGQVQSSQELLDQVRAVVAPQMVGDLERLRVQNSELTEQVTELTHRCEELQAWKDMIREATNV